jgi:hypothetical protein
MTTAITLICILGLALGILGLIAVPVFARSLNSQMAGPKPSLMADPVKSALWEVVE